MCSEERPIKATQIVLPLSFDKQFSFDNYLSAKGDFISTSLKSLIRSEGETMIGLWGGSDSGKTHLINASAYFARQESIPFQLYDGGLLAQSDPDLLSDLSNIELLLIDNLDVVCGLSVWEQKFYQIINSCKRGEIRLIFTLSENPQFLDCALDDFRSRLAWGLLLGLSAGDEEEVSNILRHRAKLMGIELSTEVIAYLLRHYSRQLSTQMEILRLLDEASLAAKKKISVPLIKQALAEKQMPI